MDHIIIIYPCSLRLCVNTKHLNFHMVTINVKNFFFLNINWVCIVSITNVSNMNLLEQ